MKIIVDLFNQHSSDLTDLKRLALNAYSAGADAVKIQVFKSEVVWGDDSRRYLEMSKDDVARFYEYCDKMGIEAFATPFDEERFEWLKSLGASCYKVASYTSKNDPELVKKMIATGKETIISTGLYSTNDFPFGMHENVKYLFCIPKYPTMVDDPKIKEMPDDFKSSGYDGYSDHVLGIAAALQSYLNGAEILEKHFTSDPNLQKNCELAHLCSFTPESLRQFKSLIRQFKIMRS
jgi:sialic acid synthase SpsE